MADKPEDLMSKANLSAKSRARVEEAMKEAIDRELVETAMTPGGPEAAGNIFSRGWIFSRLHADG